MLRLKVKQTPLVIFLCPPPPYPPRPNANIMFYSWDEKQPFAREAPPQPAPPPLIYMKAERAVRSLLGGDWDVDKPGRRAVNLDGWRPLRATLALPRIMKSSNAPKSPPPRQKKSSCLYLFIAGNERHDGLICFPGRLGFTLAAPFHPANRPCSRKAQVRTSCILLFTVFGS